MRPRGRLCLKGVGAPGPFICASGTKSGDSPGNLCFVPVILSLRFSSGDWGPLLSDYLPVCSHSCRCLWLLLFIYGEYQ